MSAESRVHFWRKFLLLTTASKVYGAQPTFSTTVTGGWALKESKFVAVHAMKGGVNVQLHAFLTLPLVGGVWSTSRPGRSTPKLQHWYPFNVRLGGGRSRHIGEDKDLLPFPGFETRTAQPVD